jgi:hypothetical protein
VSQGQHTIGLDRGAVVDGGHLVEQTYNIRRTERTKKFELIYVKEPCYLIDIYCDPKTSLFEDRNRYQAIIGIRPQTIGNTLKKSHSSWKKHFWRHCTTFLLLPVCMNPMSITTRAPLYAEKGSLDIAERLTCAATLSKSAEIISKALAHRISI